MKSKIPYKNSEQIKDIATNVLQEYGLDSNIPIDVELLAELAGFKIWPLNYPEIKRDILGFILIKTKEIYIQSELFNDQHGYEQRYRFTIAHELAHYYLHKEYYESLSYSTIDEWIEVYLSNQNDIAKAEIQANIFASHLLMPNSHLAKDLKGKKDVEQDFDIITKLAAKYNVSYHAMETKINKEFRK